MARNSSLVPCDLDLDVDQVMRMAVSRYVAGGYRKATKWSNLDQAIRAAVDECRRQT